MEGNGIIRAVISPTDNMPTPGRTPRGQKPKVQPGGNKLLLLFVFLLLLVILGATAYIVLFVFKVGIDDEPAKKSDAKAEPSKLVASIVLFHHGLRAPYKLANESIAAKFPNGAGELTEDGIEDAFNMGLFLGNRYVQSGFLRSPPFPSEFRFRGRSTNPCLMSGAVVGSAMWADPDNPEFTALALYGQEKGDRILTHLQDCEIEKKRLSEKCGKTPPKYDSWPEYEGFVFECIGLNKETQLFKNAADFAKVDAMMQEDQNGLESSWFKEHKEEIYKLYAKTYSFIVGANDYHDPEILQLKQGSLLKKILGIIRSHWAEWETSQKIAKRKFIAYSAQSWLLMAFMDALGCGKQALDGAVPGLNALLMIELRDQGGKGVVQVFYKEKAMEKLKDITAGVRGCGKSPCPLSKFLDCCSNYEIEDPKTVCGEQS